MIEVYSGACFHCVGTGILPNSSCATCWRCEGTGKALRMIAYDYRELRENAEHVLRSMQRRYPGYVSRGRLTADEMAARLKIQEATIELLAELEKAERLL